MVGSFMQKLFGGADANSVEDDVDTISRHLPSNKNPHWDDLTHEIFKQYSDALKGP